MYRLGFRPRPGTFFNSAGLDYHYHMLKLREIYRRSVEFDLEIWDSNVATNSKDTSKWPIRHRRDKTKRIHTPRNKGEETDGTK